MNELIISVARERMTPIRMGLIDYPNEQFENQLYRIAVFVAQSILDSYGLFNSWNFNEDVTLELAMKHNFPQDWLDIAKESPCFHFKLRKIIYSYKYNLSDASIEYIERVVEFLCFELIETAVIASNFHNVSTISPDWIKKGIESDATLTRIIKRQRISMVFYPGVFPGHVTPQNINVSNKAMRLLRAFIEEYIKKVIHTCNRNGIVSLEDVQKYFNDI